MTRRASYLLALVVGASSLVAGRSSAGGFSTPEPSAAALGRAGTAAAIPSGPSAVYYNPGALPFGRGLTIEAGVLFDHERNAVTPANGATLTSDASNASPTFFISQRLGNHFAMGLGLFRAPSQDVDYGSRSQVGSSQVQRARWGGLTLAPTVAGRPFHFLSIGFGLDVTFGNIDLVQAAGAQGNGTRAALSATAVGIGGSIGVWARLYKQYLSLGVAYRSSTDLDYTGKATLTDVTSAVAKLDAKTTLVMPHQITLGLGSQPRAGTLVLLEARIALLRDFSNVVVATTKDPSTTLLNLPLQLEEQWQIRAGAEQWLLSDRLAVRAGLGYDLGAGRKDTSSLLSDGDRVVVSAGLGYRSALVSFDVGYLAALSPGGKGNRGFANPAEYSSVRHTMGATLTVRMPQVGAQPTWQD